MGAEPPKPQTDLTLDTKQLDELPIQTVMGMARSIEGELSEMVTQLDAEQERLEQLDIEQLASNELEELNHRLAMLGTRFDEVTEALETLHRYLKERLAQMESN